MSRYTFKGYAPPLLFRGYLVKTRCKTVFAQVDSGRCACLDSRPPSKSQIVSRYQIVPKRFQGTARGLHINIESYPPLLYISIQSWVSLNQNIPIFIMLHFTVQ